MVSAEAPLMAQKSGRARETQQDTRRERAEVGLGMQAAAQTASSLFARLGGVAGVERSADFLEVFHLALCLVSVAPDFKWLALPTP